MAGALYARVTEGGVILIDNSSFTENTADFYGEAVVINKSSDPTGISVIQDNQFIGNKAGIFGAGITYLNDGGTNNFLVAKNLNTLFRDNHLK